MLREGMKIYIFPETDVSAYANLIREKGFKYEIGTNFIRVGKKRKQNYNSEEYAKKLKKARKAAGLTRKELADKIGCAESTVFSWEIGRTAPREYNREEIEKILGAIYDN